MYCSSSSSVDMAMGTEEIPRHIHEPSLVHKSCDNLIIFDFETSELGNRNPTSGSLSLQPSCIFQRVFPAKLTDFW